MKISCMIPARLKSTRFPRKILAPLAGKPLLQRVWEAAKSVDRFESVTILIDATETEDIVRQFGGVYRMTSPEAPSGTYRLSQAVQENPPQADIVVCWQADEPLIHQEIIDDLLQTIHEEEVDIWTLKKRITDPSSPHLTKVVTDRQGHALYFSRSPIPYFRDSNEKIYFKHIGIYAYRLEILQKLSTLPVSPLEEAEKLEQLSFLYHGFKIKVHETQHDVLGVDLPEHLTLAENLYLDFISS